MGDLAVVILDELEGARNVTPAVSGLSFGNASPGGYAMVEFDLKRRLDQARLPDNAAVRVYDTASGEQVGGGRIVEQGLTSDGAWRVSCIGEGVAALQDREEPYMVIDTNPEASSRNNIVGVKVKQAPKVRRKKVKKNAKSMAGIRRRGFKQIVGLVFAEAKQGTAPDGATTEGLLFQFPAGTSVSAGANVAAQFRGPYLCGMTLGAFTYRHRAGASSSNWKVRARSVYSSDSTADVAREDSWRTTLAPHAWVAAGVDFDDNRNIVELEARYVDTGGTTGTWAWAHVQNFILRTRLYGASGALRPGADHCRSTVTTGEVFTDVIVRRCPTLKVGFVRSGTYAHTQLAWYDPVTAKAILDEVTDTDDSVTYHAWEADTDGRTPIHLEQLPDTVRYELTADYGYSAPSSTAEVYTRVVVIGSDGDGFERRYVQDRTQPGQIRRSQTIDLEEEFTGQVAEEIANRFLDNHAAPPNAGTITVTTRVLDLWTGRYVKPYAIRSSHLCRVRGVQPSPNSLNPDAKQDGITVFRIVSATYSADSGTASLELDSPVFDEERALVELLGD